MFVITPQINIGPICPQEIDALAQIVSQAFAAFGIARTDALAQRAQVKAIAQMNALVGFEILAVSQQRGDAFRVPVIAVIIAAGYELD